MENAQKVDRGLKPEGTSRLQMAPAVLFTAVVIVFVRMYIYSDSGGTERVEFFSHYKVVFIVISALLASFVLLYRFITRSIEIKRSVFYYPIVLYVIFVVLSFVFSRYKDFAWHGWNERFEGTYVLLCYMFMLFYIINFVKSEWNVKQIIYPLAVISVILSLLGIGQYLGHDFFQTVFGQLLITPNIDIGDGDTTWRIIKEAALGGEPLFNFDASGSYQTVYNQNNVSFYLTLLIPLFILLFINERNLIKKCAWGALFILLIINLICSNSSGGFFGMFVAVITAGLVLNKRLITWWKSVVILVAITALVALCMSKTWLPEISSTITDLSGAKTTAAIPAVEDGAPPFSPSVESKYFDYIVTDKNTIHISYAGNIINITANSVDDPYNIAITDSDGNDIERENPILEIAETGELINAYGFSDPRYSGIALVPEAAEDNDVPGFKNYITVINFDSPSGAITNWPFAITDGGVFYHERLGALVPLAKIPHMGWGKNQRFGSYRGYIWSRSLPLLKDTIVIGHGADTFPIYFPQNDYVGKGLIGWDSYALVDKPHDFYLGVFINTGGLSLVCLLAIYLIYIVQSFILYRHEKYEEFCPVVGVGIFIGICGFLAAALFYDSTVSVTPMFYGLLGTGIAINMMIKTKSKGETSA
ncbi:polymerase [Spirochaetia bacterium]|nr:polymerase [Spirochaetia bacterium]